jgi:hypothetical protein
MISLLESVGIVIHKVEKQKDEQGQTVTVHLQDGGISPAHFMILTQRMTSI